jgi:hypothetical protein
MMLTRGVNFRRFFRSYIAQRQELLDAGRRLALRLRRRLKLRHGRPGCEWQQAHCDEHVTA